MQWQEEDRTLSIRVKYIEVKFRKSGTTFFTQEEPDGITLEITYKPPLEKVIISENVKKYHQIEGSCMLLDDHQLYLVIGDFDEVPQVEAILDGTYVWPDDTYPEVKHS